MQIIQGFFENLFSMDVTTLMSVLCVVTGIFLATKVVSTILRLVIILIIVAVVVAMLTGGNTGGVFNV